MNTWNFQSYRIQFKEFVAEYRCYTHQTSRCDGKDYKFSTPNFMNISKTRRKENLFNVLAISVSSQTDEQRVFFL